MISPHVAKACTVTLPTSAPRSQPLAAQAATASVVALSACLGLASSSRESAGTATLGLTAALPRPLRGPRTLTALLAAPALALSPETLALDLALTDSIALLAPALLRPSPPKLLWVSHVPNFLIVLGLPLVSTPPTSAPPTEPKPMAWTSVSLPSICASRLTSLAPNAWLSTLPPTGRPARSSPGPPPPKCRSADPTRIATA
mmetsp:Transcript_8266/g.19076  ORF Transcript_8266/g.19076 Transcript_8266/m.19076 type:complete len:202 (-) Transcript_8266:421-1026(-)